MKKVLLAALSVFCAASVAHGQNTISVSASHIQALDGTLLTSGSICFQGTDQNDRVISFQQGGGGPVITTPICKAIASGVVAAFTVPNPANTSPANVRYHIQVKQGARVVGDFPGAYLCLASGACTSPYTFNFDDCLSSGACVANPIPIVSSPAVGPTGPTGPTGPAGTVTDNSGMTVGGSARLKGPIPWRDFTTYMVDGSGNQVDCSAANSDSGATTTGSITGTALTLTAAKDFKNGCGISILHAGATSSLLPPPVTLTSPSFSGSGSTVTITVSGGHGLYVGSGNGFDQGVKVASCSDSGFNGTSPIQAIALSTTLTYSNATSGTPTSCTAAVSFGYAHGTTGSTTYVYKISAVDSAGGMSAASNSITVASGAATLTKYDYNHVMWPKVQNAVEYVVYSDLGLGGALSCVGTSFTNGYSDRGVGMPCPVFAPATPPAAATAGILSTTIVSGAGTTSLVLADAATTPASGENVYHDETPFLMDCVNDVIAYVSSTGFPNEYGCLIPSGNWWFASMMPTGTVSTGNHTVPIHVAGKVVLRAFPWFINGQYSVTGAGAGGPGGSFQSYPATTISPGANLAACAVLNGSDIVFNGMQCTSNGHGVYVVSGGALTMDDDSFTAGGTAGSPLVFDHNILGVFMNKNTLLAAGTDGQAAITFSQTPFHSASICCMNINNTIIYNHSMEFSAPGSNGSSAADNGIYFNGYTLQENLQTQDGGLVSFDGGPNGTDTAGITFGLHRFGLNGFESSDTSTISVFASIGTTFNVSNVTLQNVNVASLGQCAHVYTVCTGNIPNISGFSAFNGPTDPGMFKSSGAGINNNSNGFYVNNPMYLADVDQGSGKSALAMSMPPALAFAISGTGGGGLAAGRYCAQVEGLDSRGNYTLPTPLLCQTVGASADITYTWTEGLQYADQSYRFLYCLVGASDPCTPNKKIDGITGTPGSWSYDFTSASGTTGAPEVRSQARLSWLAWDSDATYPTCFYCSLSHSDQWPVGFGVVPTRNAGYNTYTKLGAYIGTEAKAGTDLTVTAIAVGSLPAAAAGNKGQIRVVSDSTSVVIEGQTCVGSSSNTALAFSDGSTWKCF